MTTMRTLARDLRYAIRTLRRRPLYLGAAVLTLGLGIGATTAVFSGVHGVLLTPLPVEEPEQLVRIYLEEPEDPGGHEFLTGMDAVSVREAEGVFRDVAVFYDYQEQGADVTGGDRPRRIRTLPVSSGYFRILGVEPLLGRELTRGEEREDARVAVVTHGLWRRLLGAGHPPEAGREALGATLRLDDVPYTVVGVLPPGFRDPVAGEVDVYVPQDLDPANDWNNWDNHYLSAVGRLAPGTSLEEAGERLTAVAMPLNRANRDPDNYWLPRLVPLHEDLVGRADTLLWVLLGAVGLVLLLACVNVANLSLARGMARSRELAVRAALGAGRGGLVRQLLAESLLVALAGGALGVGLAWAGVAGFRAVAPADLPRAEAIALQPAVLLFALAVSVLTGIVVGLLPALRHSGPDVAGGLREGSRGSTAGVHRLRRVLVSGQVALALVLLVGAGLLVKSFVALQQVELGFDPEGVLTYEVHLPEARYPTGETRMAFYDRLFQRIRALPEAETVGAIHWLPAVRRGYRWGLFRVDPPEGIEPIGAGVRIVEGDYFRAIGVELLRGRTFESRDRADSRLVAVINRRAVERVFPDVDPLERQIRVGGRIWTVIGVVADVPSTPLGDVAAKVYFPHAQFADNHWALSQVVSTSGDPLRLVPAVQEVVASIDPDLVLHRPRSMTAVLAGGVARQRLAATLMAGFAGLALLLALVGIYGVMAFLVGRRTHEIGIRMALGADRGKVRGMVVRESLGMAALGVTVGLLAALGLSRWLRSLVFEVTVTDPWVYGVVASGLLLVALLAAWLPARRAAGVDPMRAFRVE